jgi:hypothetical protein
MSEPHICSKCSAELTELELFLAEVCAAPLGLCQRCAADRAYLADAGLERGRSGEVYELRPEE